MNNFLIPGAFALCIAAGCSTNSGTTDRSDVKSADKIFKTQEFCFSKDAKTVNSTEAVVKIKVDYPVSGSAGLVDSVSQWMRGQLLAGCYYEFNDTAFNSLDGRNLVDSLGMCLADSSVREIDEIEKEMATPMPGYEYDWNISKSYENEYVVTFSGNMYSYTGGAHGIAPVVAGSFDKSNGNKLTYDNVFVAGSEAILLSILRHHLMVDYFNVTNYDELRDCLLIQPDELPLPALPPVFFADGIDFTYQQYEIAPYVAGHPQCTVSYSDLSDILTPLARKMITHDDKVHRAE